MRTNTKDRVEVEALFKKLKFGNIDFEYFIDLLDININHIESIDINKGSEPYSYNENGIIKHGAKPNNYFELKLNLFNNFFLNDNDNLKASLKKLSKHSKKYDISLDKVVDNLNGDERYITFKFKKAIKQKYPLNISNPLVKVETIRDIIGLKKNIDYYSISDKPCNNGWQYIFHTSGTDRFNFSYISDRLENSKLSSNYYIKVFQDRFDYIRIILLDKNSKCFFKDGIPQVTISHIAAIFGINDYLMLDSFIYYGVNDDGTIEFSDVFLTDAGLDYEPLVFCKIFHQHFGEHYDIEHIERKAFRFTLKTLSSSKDSILRRILNDVQSGQLSVGNAEEILKNI